MKYASLEAVQERLGCLSIKEGINCIRDAISLRACISFGELRRCALLSYSGGTRLQYGTVRTAMSTGTRQRCIDFFVQCPLVCRTKHTTGYEIRLKHSTLVSSPCICVVQRPVACTSTSTKKRETKAKARSCTLRVWSSITANIAGVSRSMISETRISCCSRRRIKELTQKVVRATLQRQHD